MRWNTASSLSTPDVLHHGCARAAHIRLSYSFSASKLLAFHVIFIMAMVVALCLMFLGLIVVSSNAQFADIPISRVSSGYFSDPYHVPYQHASKLHIAGTTHEYLVCNNDDLTAGCAHSQSNDFRNGSLGQEATNAKVQICGAAGIHPFQSNDASWDALVTLHVAKVRIEKAQPHPLSRNHAEHRDLDRR